MMSPRINKAHFFGAILLLGLFAFTARPATDPDLWWHLRTGQWMVENRQIPHTDPFSFTRNGSPWVSHEWLSELLLFGLWLSTGWAGLIIFSAIVTTAGFMLLFWRCAAPPHWAAAATVLGALASAPAWGVRPQMFTFLLASLWLWLLERSESRPWLLLWIPASFLLWLNLHAGFALGLALLLAYGIGLIWEGLAGETEWRLVRPHALRLLLTMGACFALVPLNPSGAQLYRYPLDVLRSGEMRAFIVEWHSPDFHQRLYLPLLLVILTLLFAFASPLVRPRPRIIVPLLGAFFAAIDAVRHIPIFVLLAVPVIATAFHDRHRPSISSPARTVPGLINLGIPVIVVVMMAIFTGAEWTKLARDQAAAETKMYPTNAVDQLASLQAPDRVFAYYDWGGYLIWRRYPTAKVFVDGRADLYGPDLLRQFQSVMQLRPGWQKILDTWSVTTIVVPSSSALTQALALDHSWQAPYKDSRATLFLRGANVSQTLEIKSVAKATVASRSHVFRQKVKKSLADVT
jgi:hypothetical protein